METTKRLNLKRNDEQLKQDIAAGLQALRSANGWTRKEMAALLYDVSESSLHAYETAARAPKGMHLLRIARLLGLDLSVYPADSIRMSGVLCAQRAARLAKKPPTPVIDFGQLISARHLLSGLSGKDFAAQWGVPTNTLRNWAEGQLPRATNVPLVAGKLGLPPSAISII